MEPSTTIIKNEVFFKEVVSILNDGDKVELLIKGDSMYPFLRNSKDKVCLVKYSGKAIEKHCLALFKYNGKYYLHRYIKCLQNPDIENADEFLFAFKGDNNPYGETVRRDDIIGIVEVVIRGHINIRKNSIAYNFFSFLSIFFYASIKKLLKRKRLYNN